MGICGSWFPDVPCEVQALLRDKADPNVKDCRSETPLLHAAAQGDLDVCSPDSDIEMIEEYYESYSMLFNVIHMIKTLIELVDSK